LAILEAPLASWSASRAFSAFWPTVDVSSSMEAAVSSMLEACSSVRADRSALPEAICEDAERESAGGCGQEHHRLEGAGRRLVEVQRHHQRRQHERVQIDVERVEHPAERRRDQRASRRGVAITPEAEDHAPSPARP